MAPGYPLPDPHNPKGGKDAVWSMRTQHGMAAQFLWQKNCGAAPKFWVYRSTLSRVDGGQRVRHFPVHHVATSRILSFYYQ